MHTPNSRRGGAKKAGVCSCSKSKKCKMNKAVQLWTVQVAAPACREVVELEAHEDPQGIVARSRASEAVAKSHLRSRLRPLSSSFRPAGSLRKTRSRQSSTEASLLFTSRGISRRTVSCCLLHLHTPHHTPPWQGALHLGRRLAGANCPTQEA